MMDHKFQQFCTSARDVRNQPHLSFPKSFDYFDFLDWASTRQAEALAKPPLSLKAQYDIATSKYVISHRSKLNMSHFAPSAHG